MIPIGGSVREIGSRLRRYFYVTIGLGTPTRTFDLIVDTGSTISYVPCAGCTHCGTHKDAPFDPAKSSTNVQLGCTSPGCYCGTPACQCKTDKCFYSRSYAERSSSSGFLHEDAFDFPDANGPVRVVFGCESDETGEIFRQAADGILGMGNNKNALHAQLVAQNVTADTFGLCFGFPQGGNMLLGDAPVANLDKMKFTPLKPGYQMHYFTVDLDGITVAGKTIRVPASTYSVGYGVVMDSGTTFTYLPTRAFKGLSEAVSAAVAKAGLKSTPGADPQFNDICWKGADDANLPKHFPAMALVFGGGVEVDMRPLQYLFKTGTGTYCLGVFDNFASGTLVGGISMRNVLVTYDRRDQRIGFLPVDDCNDLVLLPSPPPLPPPPPPLPPPPPPPLPPLPSPPPPLPSQPPPPLPSLPPPLAPPARKDAESAADTDANTDTDTPDNGSGVPSGAPPPPPPASQHPPTHRPPRSPRPPRPAAKPAGAASPDALPSAAAPSPAEQQQQQQQQEHGHQDQQQQQKPPPGDDSRPPSTPFPHPGFPVVPGGDAPPSAGWEPGDVRWVQDDPSDGLYSRDDALASSNLLAAVVLVALVAGAAQLLFTYRVRIAAALFNREGGGGGGGIAMYDRVGTVDAARGGGGGATSSAGPRGPGGPPAGGGRGGGTKGGRGDGPLAPAELVVTVARASTAAAVAASESARLLGAPGHSASRGVP
ncbi:hypothetical protein FOA52_010896 [Chlamydomonas sp. UWO 241]|nr:hypothetical protein FOA52_010896 [Chlamydomonas sp. UWO 241]